MIQSERLCSFRKGHSVGYWRCDICRSWPFSLFSCGVICCRSISGFGYQVRWVLWVCPFTHIIGESMSQESPTCLPKTHSFGSRLKWKYRSVQADKWEPEESLPWQLMFNGNWSASLWRRSFLYIFSGLCFSCFFVYVHVLCLFFLQKQRFQGLRSDRKAHRRSHSDKQRHPSVFPFIVFICFFFLITTSAFTLPHPSKCRTVYDYSSCTFSLPCLADFLLCLTWMWKLISALFGNG